MTEDERVVETVRALSGLDEVAAWKLIALRWQARALAAEVDNLRAWAARRRTLRDMDALMGVECSLVDTHAAGPTCGRCGTRPDGSVG